MEEDEKKTVPLEEASEQVAMWARRMALLYHYFGEVLVEELGEEKAKEIMKKAVWRYGLDCGQRVREGVEKMGLPLTPENFSKVPDLPKYGLGDRFMVFEDGERRPKVLDCALAQVWHQKGSEEMGRIYCSVDQAKFEAYNPDIECRHLKNDLDGDGCCLLSIRWKKKKTVTARVYRFDPANESEGHLQEFVLETEGPLSVMSLLAMIHDIDPTFACRTSKCYHGTCGSCLVRVNGKDVKGCVSIVNIGDLVTIELHSGYKPLRDIVVDFASPSGVEAEEGDEDANP
jgi:hypothetical protein